MGLTIHYSLKCAADNVEIAREKVRQLREIAKDLPFAEVGDIEEINKEDYLTENNNLSDSKKWLKVVGCKYVFPKNESPYQVEPERAIAFNVWPGEGCETATFGLAFYPAENQGDRSLWSWSSFCKTQYASNPEFGGIENFVKCHLLVIKILDEAKNLGILDSVSDEGGYWEERNLEELISRVGEYNALIAAVVGGIQDLFANAGNVKSYSPISEFPNFEYLEAEGTRQMDNKEK